MEETLQKIGFWIMIPTIMLTEKNSHKWIRVVGFLAWFPLFPLMLLGLPFLLFSVIWGVISDL